MKIELTTEDLDMIEADRNRARKEGKAFAFGGYGEHAKALRRVLKDACREGGMRLVQGGPRSSAKRVRLPEQLVEMIVHMRRNNKTWGQITQVTGVPLTRAQAAYTQALEAKLAAL